MGSSPIKIMSLVNIRDVGELVTPPVLGTGELVSSNLTIPTKAGGVRARLNPNKEGGV